MKRKRFNHHVDIFCDMFSGWKLVNDMDTLTQLHAGQFTLDILDRTTKFNNQTFDRDFHMLYEIVDWFDKDLTDNKIDKTAIRKATLTIDFISTVTDGKPKSRTKKIIEVKLKMKSTLLTDEKEYSVDKTKTIEYHYIDKK